MFYRCSNCGAVFYFNGAPPEPKMMSHYGTLCRVFTLQPVSITISNHAYEYSEAGGECTGIEVDSTVSIDAEEK